MTKSLGEMRRIWVLMGTVFVDMIGFLVVLPLLPYYGERYGASEWMIGLLISSFAFAQLTSAPLWGRLSDRLGRRPVILGSLLLSAAAFVLFGLTARIEDATLSLALLYLSRLVQGMGGGTTGVLQAYVSDSVEPEQRTQALGWLTAATSAGVMLGPLIGSSAVRLGDEAPGYIAAGLCLLNFAFAWLLLPESIADEATQAAQAAEERRERGGGPPPERTSLRTAIVQVLTHPAVHRSRLIWIYAIAMMAFMAMNGVVVLYLDRQFAVGPEQIGWFYVYVGGVSLLMRAVLLGPINRRLGDVNTMRVGAACLMGGLALAPVPGLVVPDREWGLAGLAVVILLVPVGTALLFPATTSLVSRASQRRETGQNLGVQQAFGGVSRMLGPIWSTAVFQYVGWGSPFWLAAGLMAGAAVLAFAVQAPEPRSGRGPGTAEAEAPESEAAEAGAEGETPTSLADPIEPT